MFEQLLLGTTQGITEWLPVSSEGLIVLIRINLLSSTQGLGELAQESLLLHMGTVLAAIVYFRSDVWNLLQTGSSLSYWTKLIKVPPRILEQSSTAYATMNYNERELSFVILTTLISGILGIFFLAGISTISENFAAYSKAINGLVGISLIATGTVILRTKQTGRKKSTDISLSDTIVLGIVQGCAVIPGLSRSGLTVAALLVKRYEKTTALRLSFIMSIPLVLAGNIFLNLDQLSITSAAPWGVLASFLFGLATIHILLSVARRINFGFFVIVFGILTLTATLI